MGNGIHPTILKEEKDTYTHMHISSTSNQTCFLSLFLSLYTDFFNYWVATLDGVKCIEKHTKNIESCPEMDIPNYPSPDEYSQERYQNASFLTHIRS